MVRPRRLLLPVRHRQRQRVCVAGHVERRRHLPPAPRPRPLGGHLPPARARRPRPPLPPGAYFYLKVFLMY